jgi:SAM-dependent methyltransferase
VPEPSDVLYVAPSVPTDRWLARRPRFKPTSTDLAAPGVDHHWDLTDLPVADGTFDLVLCSHVFEHIPDDAKAMSEIARILRPGGALILQVPYSDDMEQTDEDPTVTDPQERERRWGQFDHVRYYGRDIRDRLERAGFDVKMVRVSSVLDPGEMHRLGMWDDVLFECRRARSAGN